MIPVTRSGRRRRSVFAWSTALVALLATGAAVRADVVYRIDFGPTGQDVQAGFQGWSIAASGTRGGVRNIASVNPQVPLLTVTATTGTTDNTAQDQMIAVARGGPANNPPGFTFSDLIKDFVSATDSKNSAPYLNLVLDGLLANHSYDITFFEFDSGANAGVQKTDWQLAGAPKPFITFSYDPATPPVQNIDVRDSFTSNFTVDNTRKLTFKGSFAGGTQATVPLNGLIITDVTPAPEPSSFFTAVALGVLGLANVWRHRDRGVDVDPVCDRSSR